MLHSVILFLSLSISPVSAPATNVSHVFASCEWHVNSVTGISVEVCDGRRVAAKDLEGNYDVVRY